MDTWSLLPARSCVIVPIDAEAAREFVEDASFLERTSTTRWIYIALKVSEGECYWVDARAMAIVVAPKRHLWNRRDESEFLLKTGRIPNASDRALMRGLWQHLQDN